MLGPPSTRFTQSLTLLLCAVLIAPVAGAATNVSGGSITGSATWALAGSPYVVQGNVTVQSGGSLTIEAGVEVRFAGNYSLTIGGTSAGSPGTLTASGTSTSPITFLANGAPGAGQWRYVRFQAGATAGSTFDHCVVKHAGSLTAAVVCVGSSPSISNLTVEDSGSDGLQLSGSSPSLSGALTLTGDGEYLLRATATAQPSFGGVTLASSNGIVGSGPASMWSSFFTSGPSLSGGPYRLEVLTGTLGASGTWGGVANLASIDLLGDLTIQGAAGPVLTIAAGTTVRLPANGDVLVGSTVPSTPGDLVVAGTPSAPVRFERSGVTAWGSLQFRDGSTPASSVANCTLVGGGGSVGTIYCDAASPSIANVTVEGSTNEAIQLSNASPAFSGTIAQTSGSDYLIWAGQLASLPTFSGVTLSSSGKLAIGYPGFWSNLFGTGSTLSGGPYRAEVLPGTLESSGTWGGLANLASIDLQGDLTVADASAPVLTILPGTLLRFQDAELRIGSGSAAGSLDARGTAAQPIVFTTINATPAPGQWQGITVQDAAGACLLEHCTVEYAGGGVNDANLRISNSDTTVRLCTIRHSSTAGVKVAAGQPRIELNIFTANAYGLDVLSAGRPLVVRNNVFDGNSVQGIRSLSLQGFSAALNAWGDASGPSGAGPGTGDSLSGDVPYEPWLESAPSAGFEWLQAVQSPDPFTPLGAATEFAAAWTEEGAWTLEIRDGSSTLVRSFTGTAASVTQIWEGDDATGGGGLPGDPLPDGEYDWTLAASSTGSLQSAPTVRGRLTLDESLPIARITSPDPDDYIADIVTIEGTAAGQDFESYELEYKTGVAPAGGSWLQIASGSTPVTDGVLGVWDASGLDASAISGQRITLRLTVETTGAATAEDEMVSRLVSISLAAAPEYCSPNGDSVQDDVAVSASVTWPVEWTLTAAPSGGGPVVRTFQGMGDTVAQTWDGLDESAVVVADGVYDLALEVAAPGVSSVTRSVSAEVDTSAPEAAITAPAAQQTLLTIDPLQIEGTAQDDSLEEWVLSIAMGSPPGAFEQLVSSDEPVTGVPPDDDMYLLPTIEYAPDAYTLRLEVSDLAGNVSTFDRELMIDTIDITDVTSSPAIIDPASGETVEVAFTVNRDCDVEVDFHAWPGGGIVRTVAQTVLAGPRSLVWNGLDELGAFSTPDALHYFVIRANDSFGREGRFNDAADPLLGTGAFWNPSSIQIETADFDPYKNDEIRVEYQVNGWLDSQIHVNGIGLDLPLKPDGAFTPGLHVDYWEGRNQLGAIHEGNFSFIFSVLASNLPSPAVFLERAPIRFAEFRAEAYLIHPIFSQVSGFTYELIRDAEVTITVEDPNGNHVRTVLDHVSQSAGEYDLEDGIGWDGKDEAGRTVSLEGSYPIVLSATDLLTGKVFVRRGVVTVYR